VRILLDVKTRNEALDIINLNFPSAKMTESFCSEKVGILDSTGRILHADITAKENVPGFNRSTVDGYAVLSADTFGCSESNPAILILKGEILMGESADRLLEPGTCLVVSTGGEIPENADAVIMHEYTEDYENGMIGFQKPAAPGNNIIFKDDDAAIGDVVLKAGTLITPRVTGMLAALGCTTAEVRCRPIVAVISTGDELVPVSTVPKSGQVRDVNTTMLFAAIVKFGAEVKDFGIIKDDEKTIRTAMLEAAEISDIVLISGGSSAGTRDMTAKVIESEGELLLHGIAIKPGKPTILGKVKEKPVFGLPGHPVAAYMVTELFVRPLITRMTGVEKARKTEQKRKTTKVKLSEAISSNHGREEYIAVKIDEEGTAHPVKGKSGLISNLADADGYICIPGDTEGLKKGAEIILTYF